VERGALRLAERPASPKFLERSTLNPDEWVRQAGLSFSDNRLLWRALTHRSYLNEHPESLEDNERLEYLGDATLDFISAAWLYNHFPEMNEGSLTRLRSALVRTEQLARFAEELNLGQALLLGRGEESTGGRQRPAILCASFEALIGAMYLDQGLEWVTEFMEPRLHAAAEAVLEDERLIDARSILQMWAQAELGETPKYETIGVEGPDHAREFTVRVQVGDEIDAQGTGHSKQDAAQRAASAALERLNHIASERERKKRD
jgi:ribonuclease-3